MNRQIEKCTLLNKVATCRGDHISWHLRHIECYYSSQRRRGTECDEARKVIIVAEIRHVRELIQDKAYQTEDDERELQRLEMIEQELTSTSVYRPSARPAAMPQRVNLFA